ncbi:MAG: hypothetical protein ACXVX6_02850 [Mycobacterium sp.]
MPPYPEEPDYYSEPTQAARYGGYYDEPALEPEPPTPWYRRPAALVAAGAIGVILLAALVFAVLKLATGSPAYNPAITTTTIATTTPSTTVTTTTSEPPRYHGGGGGGAPTETVTETAPPPSTDTPTTTEPPSTVTVSPSTETSTVTQTVTVPPRRLPFGGPFGGR